MRIFLYFSMCICFSLYAMESNLEELLQKYHEEHTQSSLAKLNIQITGNEAEKNLALMYAVSQDIAKYIYTLHLQHRKEDARIFWDEWRALMSEICEQWADQSNVTQNIETFAKILEKQCEKVTEDYCKQVDRMFQEEGAGNAIFQRIEERFDQLFRRWIEQINRVGGAVERQGAYLGIIGVASVAGMAVAYYLIKLQFNYLNRLLKRPSIITQTSYRSWWQKLVEKYTGTPEKPIVRRMIFPSKDADCLDSIIKSTQLIAQKIKDGDKHYTHRNLLLHGKPGTGKTMFARQLAHQSGMEFVALSGAAFAKFIARCEGISALDELFDWANTCEKGLLIFIDEIDAFAYKRDLMSPEGFDLKTFNNFLHHVNGRSNRYMIVMATNRIEIIDDALLDRVDELIYMRLPDKQQRRALLKFYRDEIHSDLLTEHLDDAKIEEIVGQTEGLSCRGLESLIHAIAARSFLHDDEFSDRAMDTALARSIDKLQMAMANE